MNLSKTAEWGGFLMIILAFVLWLAKDFGYFVEYQETVELMGIIGVIFWSIGYMQKENAEKLAKAKAAKENKK